MVDGHANIILTGFMGTGKTTVGRLVASQIGYTFVDTDELIRARAGKSIPAIFREEGEGAFRAWEARIVRELAQRRALVIATGGGMLVAPANAQALGATGRVVCLTAAPEEILARVGQEDDRPLLAGPDPAGRIAALLAARAAAYGRFPQVDTTGKTPDQVAREVLAMAGK